MSEEKQTPPPFVAATSIREGRAIMIGPDGKICPAQPAMSDAQIDAIRLVAKYLQWEIGQERSNDTVKE